MKEFVESVAKALVDRPDEVEVEVFDEDDATVFELRVAQQDLGKVIGKRGRTARALRTLLDAAGIKQDEHFELEIVE